MLLLVGRTLLATLAGRALGIHVLQDDAAEQHLGVGGRVSFIDVGVAVGAVHAVQDGILFSPWLRGGTRRFTLVIAPVANPSFAEDILPKAALVIPIIGGESALLGDARKSVGTGPGADDRHTAFHRGIELSEGRLIPLTEAKAEHDRVGAIKGFRLSERTPIVRVDHAVVVRK